jgi:hypothetical protein
VNAVKASVNGHSADPNFEEIAERWHQQHSIRRVRKARKTKAEVEESRPTGLVPGGVPIWNEAKSLRQDYRCKCREWIRVGTWHALNIETGQRLCIDCALDMGLPRNLFRSYYRGKG